MRRYENLRRMARPLGRLYTLRRRCMGRKRAVSLSVPTEEDSAACLGHGVGMSQYGALAMAQRGLTAEDILMHYYTGCELSRLG